MDATLGSEARNDGGVRECTIARGGEGRSPLIYLSQAMQLCMWFATAFKEQGNPVGHLPALIGSEIWTARVNRSRMLRGWKVSFSTAEGTQEALESFMDLHRVLERAQAVTGCELPVDQLAAALCWISRKRKRCGRWLNVAERRTRFPSPGRCRLHSQPNFTGSRRDYRRVRVAERWSRFTRISALGVVSHRPWGRWIRARRPDPWRTF
jgi:hypothetical protein